MIIKSIKKIFLETFYPYKFHYLVSSFGGVGNSMWIKFLNPDYTTYTNHMHYHLELKHVSYPPEFLPENIKTLYLFGNPMNSVISIFNRNLQHIHYRNIFNKVLKPQNMTFEYFLDQGVDIFHLEQHFQNWMNDNNEARNYPIILIKYETMWDNLEYIFDFLGLEKKRISEFPDKKERKSDWRNQPKKIREKLLKIYTPLLSKINNSPEVKII